MVLGRLAESVAAYAFLTRSARSICGSSSRSSFSLSISFTLVSVLSQVSSTLVLQPDIQSFQCNNIRGNRTSFQSLLRLHVVGMSMVSSP